MGAMKKPCLSLQWNSLLVERGKKKILAHTWQGLMTTFCCCGVLLPWVFFLPLSTSKEFHWSDKQGFFMAATSMFSFIGLPAFVIALVIAIGLHLIAAVVLWVSWAVPIGGAT